MFMLMLVVFVHDLCIILSSLDVWRTRLFTVGDRAFPVAAARLWNSHSSVARHCCPQHLPLSS